MHDKSWSDPQPGVEAGYRLTVNLPPDAADDLDRICARDGLAASDAVCRALYVDDARSPLAASLTRATAAARRLAALL